MTEGEWLAYCRSLINEPTAKFWTDVEIGLYQKVGMVKALSNFWELLYPFYKKRGYLTVTALTAEVSLPADFFRLGKVEIKSTGEVLRYMGNENELADYDPDSPGIPQGWAFCNKGLILIPTATASSTTTYRLWYMPKLSSLVDFPEELHPLIAVEACMASKIKDEDRVNELAMLQGQFAAAAEVALAKWQIQEPDVLPGSIDEYYGQE